jgi:small-conductance mechanosensitive channel
LALAASRPLTTPVIDTVRALEGVMPDNPVDALYNEMGDSAMIFRVRWWLESYAGRRRSLDRVHTALQAALTEAGISAPFPRQSLDLEIGQDTTERLSEVLRERS